MTLLLAAIVAAGALPVPSPAVASPGSSRLAAQAPAGAVTAGADVAPLSAADQAAADETAGQHPSIAYEEAMAHAGDRIAFTPGDQVDVAFAPRAGDAWPIDGKAPTTLPAGRASGRDMAKSPQGSDWAVVGSGETGKPAGTPGNGPDSANTTPDATPAPDPSLAPDATPAPVDAPAGDPSTPATGAAYVQPQAASGADLAAAAGLRRQVFGFLPYWELSGASTKLNYDVLSTIAYFSVGADSAGNLKKKDPDGTSTTGWGGWASSSMGAVISAAHQRGTRVVLTISVFAWTTGQANLQKALLGSPTARLNLAKQAAAAVRDRGADGINLDFEPIASGYADEFVALLKTFRSELNKVHSGYQLTYDTTGYIGNYPLEASVAAGAADAIFVMGYDYRTASSTYAGSIDPLSGPSYDLTDTVRSYTARVAPSRVILGIPWYGRAWSTVSSAVRAQSQSGEKYGYSTAVNYENVLALVTQYGRLWDSVEQSPYVAYQRQNCTTTYGCVTSWRQVYYDDAASMKARYQVVNDYGLRGAGMWALGYDGGHSELYRAISESFLVDKSGPQAGITTLAGTQLGEGFPVTWSAKDATAVASYDVQVSVDGGAWTPWLTATRATSDVWLGKDGHGYAFRVRGTDTRGNVGTWNVASTWTAAPALTVGGFGTVTLDGLAYRTGPGTGAAKLGTLAAGTIVAVTSGPVSADGYTWWEVTQPITEWGPVSFVERGVWIAGGTSSATYVAAFRAPNSTAVDAGLVGLDFGVGGSTVGATAAAVAARQLSPNGDRSGDVLRLRWTSTVAYDTLTLNVFRLDGTIVGSAPVTARGTGPQAWDWNGQAGGARVPDGRYVLQLVGTAAGRTYTAPSPRPVTTAQIAAYAVIVDTVPPTAVSASASSTLISPNGDGLRETAAFAMAASGGATHWTVTITNAASAVVRSFAGAGASLNVTWNGADNAGARVPDGIYRLMMAEIDNAGNAVVRGYMVTVDTTPALYTVAVSPVRFSPDGDGVADTSRLSWSASEPVTGVVRILKGTTVIRSWPVTARGSWAVAWDGRNASGVRVGDGTYTFGVDARDAAGNRRIASTTVTIDRTAGWLRWSRSFFPQDNDALVPTAVLSYRLARTAATSLGIYDASGTLVRTVWTGQSQPAGTRTWTWNGKLANGSYVAQGLYRAVLTVTSGLGTTVLSRPVWVTGFAIGPSATTVVAGQRLTVNFSSIEPLSTRPVVALVQPGRAAVYVTATRLTNGSYRAVFTIQTGPAGPATITVSAKDSSGRRNTTQIGIKVAS